jgi:hypothetical protein
MFIMSCLSWVRDEHRVDGDAIPDLADSTMSPLGEHHVANARVARTAPVTAESCSG